MNDNKINEDNLRKLIYLRERELGINSELQLVESNLVMAIEKIISIAPSFADIFYNNSLGNGLLPIKLSAEDVDKIFKVLESKPGTQITIDLEKKTVDCADLHFEFDLDPFRRHCLLEGLDAISLTMQHQDEIAKYEQTMPSWRAHGTN